MIDSERLEMKNEFSNDSKNTTRGRVSGRFAVRDMKQTVEVGVTKAVTPKQAAATKKTT